MRKNCSRSPQMLLSARTVCVVFLLYFVTEAYGEIAQKQSDSHLRSLTSYIKRYKLKIERYLERNSRLSLYQISEEWNAWFMDPGTRGFIELFRKTLALFVVQSLVAVRKCFVALNEHVSPKSRQIVAQYVEPYIHFNPYDHMGLDSVSQYIQRALVVTFFVLTLPITISLFGWIRTFVMGLCILVMFTFGGILTVYKFVLLILSVIVVLVDSLVLYPYLIPVVVLFFFYFGRSDQVEDLRYEIKTLHRAIKSLNERIDRIKNE